MTNEEEVILVLKELKDWKGLPYCIEEPMQNEGIAVITKEALDVAIKALEQQPKTGHWIKTGDYYTGAYECLDYFECSCCHEESLEEGDYCPNCGADMRESEDKV